MKIAGIDFPKKLLDALRDGSLVVFAGAGVSMGEPAKLPNFIDLADKVACGTGEKPRKGELADAFLGRLAAKDDQVHSRAAEILSRPDLKPTDLHRSLARLYAESISTRIVTTNFDRLFEQAAYEVFGSCPEVFKAPALPLGGNFNGVVHVHGSVDRPEEMVLTDADFGRGYLTEGWARRFLLDLFDSSTVLFVGYSHDDVVMNYLARALPVDAAGSRFVLTDKEDGDRWQLLGIEPVLYERSPDGSHSALQKGISGLANHVSRGVLGWQREITDIASSPPALDEEAMDLIDHALSDPMRARFFTDAASDPEWVGWLDSHGHLDALFVPTDQRLTEQNTRLSRWLATSFTSNHPDVLFLLIQRKGMRLHRVFWWELGRAVGADEELQLDVNVLSRWVSLLLTTMTRFPDEHVLLWLGERCADAGLTDSLLDIFDAMIVNHLVLQPGFAISEDSGPPPVTAQFKPSFDEYAVRQLWERHLKPKLDQVADRLLADAVQKFSKQHRLLCSWQSADENWDPTSFRRSAIEPHEQDGHPRTIDVLIDAARDSLQHLAIKRPSVAAYWCDYLARAEAPLLRRLAVHTLSWRKDIQPDEKIDWLLESVGLHDHATHHEIFQSVRIIYPHLSPEHRRAVVDAVLAYEWSREGDADRETRTALRHFTWLDWLRRSDPNCDLVGDHLDDLLQRYPDFRPREHPDLTHYMSVGSGPQSPWAIEELLSQPAPEWLDDLLRFQDADSFDSSRDALLRAISDAAIQDFNWGVALADALAGLDHWDSDLWPVLLGAWSREMDEDKHRVVLDRLGNAAIYSKHTRAVADLLYELVKNGGVPYAARLLPEMNELAATLWGVLDPSDRVPEMDDWLHRAINHSAGTLAEFWIHSLSVKRQQQEPKPRSFDDEYASAFSGMVGDKTVLGQLAQTVLAQYLGFILAADEDWAKKYLLPLFENPHDKGYRPVWHGVLYANLNAEAASALEDASVEAMSRVETLFSAELRRQFVEHYASMAVYLVDDPLEAWIPKFFANAADQDRREFAWNISHELRRMDDAKQRDLWERWLGQYWRNRLQGIPKPLADPEVAEMLSWVPNLTAFFLEAVEYAIQMPKTSFQSTLLLHDLNKGDAWSKYPEATLRLLKYMADCDPSPSVWHEGGDLIKKLRGLELSEELDTQLQELAVRLNLP